MNSCTKWLKLLKGGLDWILAYRLFNNPYFPENKKQLVRATTVYEIKYNTMEKELKEVSQSLEKANIKAQGIKFEPDDALKLSY